MLFSRTRVLALGAGLAGGSLVSYLTVSICKLSASIRDSIIPLLERPHMPNRPSN